MKPSAGRIADTPGFASLEANRAGFIPKENLEHAFPEFGPYLGAVPVHRLLPPHRKGLRRPGRAGGGQAFPDPVRQLLRHVRRGQGREGVAAPESVKGEE